MKNKFYKVLLITLIFLLNSCIAKNISQKGFIFDDEDLSNINIGLTNKENTLKYLGYPLNKSYFNDNIWIYYSYRMKEVLFFKPKLMDQKVLLIEFDKETDVIKDLSLYNVNSNNYEILNQVTDNNVDRESIIKDILKNIGQISM